MSEQIKLLKNVKAGPFVEFSAYKKEENYSNWNPNSLYLDEGIFSMYSDPFDKASLEFNYFGPTKYEKKQLDKLIEELKNHLSKLRQINSHERFLEIIKSFKIGQNFLIEYGEFKDDWREILNSLIEIDQTLINMVEKINKEDKVLWVLGI